LLEASEKWRSEKKFNAYPQNSAKQERNTFAALCGLPPYVALDS
jgi:hypothetical protein